MRVRSDATNRDVVSPCATRRSPHGERCPRRGHSRCPRADCSSARRDRRCAPGERRCARFDRRCARFERCSTRADRRSPRSERLPTRSSRRCPSLHSRSRISTRGSPNDPRASLVSSDHATHADSVPTRSHSSPARSDSSPTRSLECSHFSGRRPSASRGPEEHPGRLAARLLRLLHQERYDIAPGHLPLPHERLHAEVVDGPRRQSRHRRLRLQGLRERGPGLLVG